MKAQSVLVCESYWACPLAKEVDAFAESEASGFTLREKLTLKLIAKPMSNCGGPKETEMCNDWFWGKGQEVKELGIFGSCVRGEQNVIANDGS